MKRCQVEGCDRKYLCKGYCSLHYDRARRSGDPTITKRQPARHGTLNMYGNRGCRCDECKAAQAAYSRGRKAVLRRENPEKWKRDLHSMNLRKLYGIDHDEYDRMLAAQGGACAICKEPPGLGQRNRLCVDHCHETGVIRGLLCFRCNSAIGMLKDDPALVQVALDYLTTSVRAAA